MNCYSNNLAALFQRNAALAKRLHTVTTAGVRITESRNGLPNLEEQDVGGEWNPLHSSYDPIRESRDRAVNAPIHPDAICVILGFGAGYLLEVLLERKESAHAHFLVIEPNASVFKEALRCRDLRKILSCPAIDFHIGTDLETLGQGWEALPPFRRTQPPCVIQHFASVKSHVHFYHAALTLIKRLASKSRFDIGNLAKCSRLFFDNLIENLPAYLADPGVFELKDRFENIPAILISAGPSLDKNIHLLKEIGDSAVLVAVDAAVRPLLAQGIEPHFILSVDPQTHNAAHLLDVRVERAQLVLEASVYPETMRRFAGRRYVAALEGSFYHFLLRHIEDKGQLRGWGSVATLAFDFARKLGCDPIIFLGQDLSFTGGRTYCDNIVYQTDWFRCLHSEEELRSRYRDILQSQECVPAADVFGGETQTTPRLLAYAQWLSSEIQSAGDVRCINATEGGILAEGMEQMSFKEALFRHCRKDRAVWERLPSRPTHPSDAHKLKGFVRRTLQEISGIKKGCQQGLLDLDRWREKGSRESPDEFIASSQRWWERFQTQTFHHAQTARALEFFNQEAIQRFLRATLPEEMNAGGIHQRYHQFISSILECADYLEAKLKELEFLLQPAAAQKTIGDQMIPPDEKASLSGAK